jgi:hypothetical protein
VSEPSAEYLRGLIERMAAASAAPGEKPLEIWELDLLYPPPTEPDGPPDCFEHREVQHRDGQKRWCDRCGWRHARPATPAVKLGEPR